VIGLTRSVLGREPANQDLWHSLLRALRSAGRTKDAQDASDAYCLIVQKDPALIQAEKMRILAEWRRQLAGTASVRIEGDPRFVGVRSDHGRG
jgi:hypothetical protein